MNEFLNFLVFFVLTVAVIGFGQESFARYWVVRHLNREFNVTYTGLRSAAGWWVSLGNIGELKLGFRDSGGVRWVDVPPTALLDIGVTEEDLSGLVPYEIYQLSPLASQLTRISRAVLLEKVSGN